MMVMSGKEVSQKIRENLEVEIMQFKIVHGFAPLLAVVLVGSDPASQTYVGQKKQACIELGYGHRDYVLDETVSEEELMTLVESLNSDDQVHGLLVQMPLPSHIDAEKIIDAIHPLKDVDGFHPYNVGKLLIGNPGLVPCTPLGVLEMLDYYKIPTSGKRVCIVGRSTIVGKPMAALLMQKGRDATVTICHTKTQDLAFHTLHSDIIIAAVGNPGIITASMVREGAVVIDVGITRIEDSSRARGWRLAGDVDYEQVASKCFAITPVPGGVGPMTITMLLSNTLKAARLQVGA